MMDLCLEGRSAGVLSVRDLTLTRGEMMVLSGLNLDLRQGEVTVIVGANGAGKSTLLAALSGLLAPRCGVLTLDGEDLLELSLRRRAQRIAFLPQQAEIAWAVEVETLVGLGRTPHLGALGPTRADAEAVARALEAAGLAAYARRLATDLSGGERARALIARGLATEADWLLADEPFAALDPAFQLQTAALFRSLAARGAGVVLTVHDLSLALHLADRLVVLGEGRILADDAPARALSAEVLRRAYGVAAHLVQGRERLLVEVTGLAE